MWRRHFQEVPARLNQGGILGGKEGRPAGGGKVEVQPEARWCVDGNRFVSVRIIRWGCGGRNDVTVCGDGIEQGDKGTIFGLREASEIGASRLLMEIIN